MVSPSAGRDRGPKSATTQRLTELVAADGPVAGTQPTSLR
jgi:hypothetical protein